MKTAELGVCCICALFYFKQFAILCKFLWKVRVSVLVFEFLGHLELFVRPNFLELKFLGEWIICSLIKGEATWIVTKTNSTERFSWPSSSIESMRISSLASVGFSSSLLKILHKPLTSDGKLYNTQYVTRSKYHQKKILGWNQRPMEISCHGRLQGYSGPV